MIRVISDAHVPGNDGYYFVSVVRDGNSARLCEHYPLCLQSAERVLPALSYSHYNLIKSETQYLGFHAFKCVIVFAAPVGYNLFDRPYGKSGE